MARFTMLVILACLALSVSAQAPDQGTNYNAGDHGRSETVGPDGEVQGQYHYTDSDGKLITVKYRAGKDGFQVEGDHLPKAPQPQAAPAQQPQYYNNQPQQPFFQPQQQQQQPQFYNPQQQQQQPQYFNNNNQNQFQQQSQYQQQQQQPIPQLFQNFGQPQQQQQQQQFSHPNALQGQNFQAQPQAYYNQGQQQGQYRPSKVSVSQAPGTGFTYNIES